MPQATLEPITKSQKLIIPNPVCPKCGCDSYRKGQNHLGKYRYICKVCKKGFFGADLYPIPSIPCDPTPEPVVNIPECDRASIFLELCRRRTFNAVRSVRSGMIPVSIAKKIVDNAFPNTSVLPDSRSLVCNARSLRFKVCRAAVAESIVTEAIAHLISYLAFPDGED